MTEKNFPWIFVIQFKMIGSLKLLDKL